VVCSVVGVPLVSPVVSSRLRPAGRGPMLSKTEINKAFGFASEAERGQAPLGDETPSAMNVAPLVLPALTTRCSHAEQRSEDVVWSHVRCASAV
jgi:hypothetical protein